MTTRKRRTRALRFWLLQHLVVPLSLGIIKLWMRTWRIEVEGREALEQFGDGSHPRVMAAFHGTSACVLGHLLQVDPKGRRYNGATMVSTSRDGDLMASVAHSFNSVAVRGSTKKRAAAGLLALIHEVQRGRIGMMAVDGPRGPRGKAQPGVLTLAKATGARVFILVHRGENSIRFKKAWDKYDLPKPFSRVRAKCLLWQDFGALGPDQPAPSLADLQRAMIATYQDLGEDVSDMPPLEEPPPCPGS
ncbi:MAG: DUF374 domain-containing protein [Sumerlaeia bacterium]